MPYMYATYACLICMPYMYATYACLICMPQYQEGGELAVTRHRELAAREREAVGSRSVTSAPRANVTALERHGQRVRQRRQVETGQLLPCKVRLILQSWPV